MKRNSIGEIDLGWTKVNFDLIKSSQTLSDRERLFEGLFGSYGFVFFNEEESLGNSLKYKISSPWYISEIEDLLRTSLFLFDKIIIEPPHMEELEQDSRYSHFISDTYIDNEGSSRIRGNVYCDYTFFQDTAIQNLVNLMGDAISKEVTLLPNFNLTWDEIEEEYDEEYDAWVPYGRQADPYHVGSYLKTLGYAYERLAKCNELQFEKYNSDQPVPVKYEISVPTILTAKISDLILLRRDEKESFLKWRDYLNDVLSHSNKTESQVSEAIFEGLAELNDRFTTLKRKGILDALGGGLIAGSVAVAFFIEGQPGTVSGSLATLSTAAAVAKAIVEQRAEKKKLTQHDLYFLWLTRKLHDWNKINA